MIAKRRDRIIFIAAIVSAAIGSISLFARYQGLVFPVRIGSGSMAESLVGPHRRIHCSQCGLSFRCDIGVQAPLGQAACPNCGFVGNELSGVDTTEGDRVLIDRWAYWFDKPQHGDIVAIIDPSDSTQLAVKRIAALPNETISIVRGELFIDGEVHRKSLNEALELATLVHDDTFRVDSERDLPNRWYSDAKNSGWRATTDGYISKSSSAASISSGWLTYHHWRCYASPHPRTEEAPISDHYAYNQGLSRVLHEVSDIILTCDLSCLGDGEISFVIHDGRESFTFQLSTQSRFVHLLRGDSALVQATVSASTNLRDTQISIAVLDQQLCFAIGDKTLIREAYNRSELPLQPTSRPLAISASINELKVTELRIFRDVYYLNEHRGNWAWPSDPATVPANNLFFLGDNQPLSNDSRHWARTFVSEADVIGKVTLLSR